MDEKKEGFSYSRNARNSTALAVLGVELLAMVVVVVLIFGILNYFLIFPLSVMNPKLFGWLPVSKNLSTFKFPGEKAKISNPSQVKKGQDPRFPLLPTIAKLPDISFISDVPKYTLTVSDISKVEEILNKWNVYAYLQAQNKGKPLETIGVHLTDKEQPYNKVTNPKAGVVTSSNLIFSNKTAELLIYISPTVLNDAKLDSGQFFTSAFYSTLYTISHPAKSAKETQAIFDQMSKEILRIIEEDKAVFIVKKQ